MTIHHFHIRTISFLAYSFILTPSYIDANFAYPSRKEDLVLENMNIDFPEGKTIALVGSSGSGKSTLTSLVQRFYDVSKGHLLLDGRDIKDYDLEVGYFCGH